MIENRSSRPRNIRCFGLPSGGLFQSAAKTGQSAVGPNSVIRAEPKPRPFGSTECRHLQFGSLAINGLTGIVDGSFERLPRFADNVFVGGDDAFYC